MRTEDITAQFDLLHSKWQDGEIDFETFRQALAFRDAEGNGWRLTVLGEWRKQEKDSAGQGSSGRPPPVLQPVYPDLWQQLSESEIDATGGHALPSASLIDRTRAPAVSPSPPEEARDEPVADNAGMASEQEPSTRRPWLKVVIPGIVILLLVILVTVTGLSRCSPEAVSPTAAVSAVAEANSAIPGAGVETAKPPTATAGPSVPPTATSSPTPAPSRTQSPSPQPTSTSTPFPRPSNTPTLSPTPWPSDTPTVTPPPTQTGIPSPVATTTNTPKPPTNTPSPSPAKPTSPRLSGQIIFPLFDPVDQEIDIFVADLTGDNRRLLIENASQPGVDRQLHRFTYRSWQSDNRGLIIQEIQTTLPLTLQEGIWRVTESFEAARLALSPDGEDLIYPSKENMDRQWRLYDINNEILRRAGQDVSGSAPTWLPDGRLVFNHCQGNACGLFLMRRDGSDYRQLTQSPQDTSPDASPDGKLVAFMSKRDGNLDIYTVAAAGGPVVRLTIHSAHDALPAWSPNGQWIAFISNRQERWAVWVMTPDGSQEQRLFDLGGVPGGCPAHAMDHECGGWAEERIVWIP